MDDEGLRDVESSHSQSLTDTLLSRHSLTFVIRSRDGFEISRAPAFLLWRGTFCRHAFLAVEMGNFIEDAMKEGGRCGSMKHTDDAGS